MCCPYSIDVGQNFVLLVEYMTHMFVYGNSCTCLAKNYECERFFIELRY